MKQIRIILRLFIVAGLLLKSFPSFSQDSLLLKSDSSQAVKGKTHSPLFAGISSAIIPGGGQVYNHKYWKVPIVYAGLLTAGYFIYFNGNVYYTVNKNLNSQVAGDSIPQPQFLILNNIFSKTTIDLNIYTYDELIQLEEDYRKYFTLSIIVTGAIYMLNVFDAVVDAHLYHFDVSDDLSLDVHPRVFQAFNSRVAPGLSLSFTLK